MGLLQFLPLGLLLLARLSTAATGNEFSYDGKHGPSHWGEEYRTCIGKHQSPINIMEHNVKNTSFPTLEFIGLENPRSSYLVNNGHTVMLAANGSEAAMITGGPLGNKTYVFEQLHFHWGENDLEGSEDLINNHSFAMELHAVFYNKAYGSAAEAMKHSDGLTVLAYFYEVGNVTNPTYDSMVDLLPRMETPGAKYVVKEPLLLSKLLQPNPSTMQIYYTYEGSLTTPPCLEVVTWIDFKVPQILSHDQLQAFRNIKTTDGKKLTHNFRPIQPIDDRVVYHNIPNISSFSDTKGKYTNQDMQNDRSSQQGLAASALLTAILTILGIIFIRAH